MFTEWAHHRRLDVLRQLSLNEVLDERGWAGALLNFFWVRLTSWTGFPAVDLAPKSTGHMESDNGD